MIPHRSAAGSSSKESDLDFIILKKLKIGRTDGQTDERTVGRTDGWADGRAGGHGRADGRVDGPKIGMTPLGIMFLAIRAACSMVVRAMRSGVWVPPGPPMVSYQFLDLGWMVFLLNVLPSYDCVSASLYFRRP